MIVFYLSPAEANPFGDIFSFYPPHRKGQGMVTSGLLTASSSK